MNISSFNTDLEFDPNQVKTKLILQTPFSKEIRIAMHNGLVMKEHASPFPIIIHVLDGAIDLGVEGKIIEMKAGDIITLEGRTNHDLSAKANSIVRLTISTQDTVERVQDVVNS